MNNREHVFQIERGELHVWKAFFSEHKKNIEDFLRILSKEELHRARKFHFQKDSEKYIIGRALLRWILSQYTSIEPQDIEFTYTPYGKPVLQNSRNFNFNVSHSNDVLLVALTADADVGIDVEYIREDFNNEDIADQYFSQTEAAALRVLPECDKALGFYLCWTRKEAYIKAKERGLSLSLKQFDVSVSPGDPPRLLRTTFDRSESERWNLYDLTPAENYAGAVAINIPLSNIHYFSL
jgi:4'-phosphopantetheinyl transferase